MALIAVILFILSAIVCFHMHKMQKEDNEESDIDKNDKSHTTTLETEVSLRTDSSYDEFSKSESTTR